MKTQVKKGIDWIRKVLRKSAPRVFEVIQTSKYLIRKWVLSLRRKRNKSLEAYRGMYAGKRCFIIATGPSLTLDDVNKLKDEYTFGVNSILNIYSTTDWRPDFYCISDPYVFDLLKTKISDSQFRLFFHNDIIPYKGENGVRFYLDPLPFKYTFSEHYKRTGESGKLSYYLPKDISHHLCDGPTVVLNVLQLAIHMGFSEIYLLGVDSTFPSTEKHASFAEYQWKKKKAFKPCTTQASLIQAYESINRGIHEQSLKCKVYNATRGGVLEVFPRVDLDDVLKKDNG